MGTVDIEKILDEMIEFFGDNLANPEHEPKRFAWQVKFYKYMNRSKAEFNSQKE